MTPLDELNARYKDKLRDIYRRREEAELSLIMLAVEQDILKEQYVLEFSALKFDTNEHN